MSDQDLPAQSATGAGGQSPPLTTPDYSPRRRLSDNTIPIHSKRRRSADITIKDQDAVRDYLNFKQTKGLMTESEKRLLDKIASVCGLSIDSLLQQTTSSQNPTRKA